MVDLTDMKVQGNSNERLFRNGEGNVNTNGLKKDESTKFTIQYGAGHTFKIYHDMTNKCICRGLVDSSKLLVVAKDSCDPGQCSINLTKIQDLNDWLLLGDFQLYFYQPPQNDALDLRE